MTVRTAPRPRIRESHPAGADSSDVDAHDGATIVRNSRKGHARLAQDDGSHAESAVIIRILLPDAYLRVDTIGGTIKATGFEGGHLLTAITEGAERSVPTASMADALLKGERARLTRLLMGSVTVLTPVLRLVGRSAPLLRLR